MSAQSQSSSQLQSLPPKLVEISRQPGASALRPCLGLSATTPACCLLPVNGNDDDDDDAADFNYSYSANDCDGDGDCSSTFA